MINGLIFDNRNNTAKDWGNILRKVFPTDGVLCGCNVDIYMNAEVVEDSIKTQISVAPGYFVMCGRVLQNDDEEVLDLAPQLENGYIRLKYVLDMTQEAGDGVFAQGRWEMDYSAVTAFPAPIQQDINDKNIENFGRYEVEFAVFQIVNGSIRRRERAMRSAGLEALNLYGKDETLFSIRRVENDGASVVEFVIGKGSAGEKRVVELREDGSVTVPTKLAVSDGGARSLNIGWNSGGVAVKAAKNGVERNVLSANDDGGVVLGDASANLAVNTQTTVFDRDVEVKGTLSMGSFELEKLSGNITTTGTITMEKELTLENKLNFKPDCCEGLFSSGKRLITARAEAVLIGEESGNQAFNNVVIAAPNEVVIKNGYTPMMTVKSSTVDIPNLTGEKIMVSKDLTVEGKLTVPNFVAPTINVTDTLTTNKLVINGSVTGDGKMTVPNLLVSTEGGHSGLLTVQGRLVSETTIEAKEDIKTGGNFTTGGNLIVEKGGYLKVVEGTMVVDKGDLKVHDGSVILKSILMSESGVLRIIASETIIEDTSHNPMAFSAGQITAHGILKVLRTGNNYDTGNAAIDGDLTVGGKINGQTFGNNSNLANKTEIQEYTGALSTLRNTTVFQYKRKETGKQQIGLVIEDEGCPQEVLTAPKEEKGASVDLYSYISMTTRAVQELAEEKDAQIAQLQARLDKMEQMKN